MKKLTLISAFLTLTFVGSTYGDDIKDASGIDAQNLAGVIVKTHTEMIPVDKTGKRGKIKRQAETTLVHNQDSGMSLDQAKQVAQKALNEHNKDDSNKAETLGLFSTITGAVSSVVGTVGKLLTGGNLLSGVV